MKDPELELLKDKCLLYTQFLIRKLSSSPEMIKGFEETYRLVEKAYEKEKLKPLMEMSLEIDDQVICHMPLSMAIEFRNLVREKLHLTYDAVDRAHLKVVERIIEREKIMNNEEYKLIMSRVDEIFSDAAHSDELKRLNEMLSSFEKAK